MRATILLTALLTAGASHAETPAANAPAAASACPCAETATIDLGAAPEPESAVTIAPGAAPTATATATGFGASARSWVDLQTGGSAASVTPRPLPGDAASNAYERYANSFKHPVPESFKRESFASDGAGSK